MSFNLKSHPSMSDHIIGLLIRASKMWRSEGLQLSPLHPNPKDPHSPPVSLYQLLSCNAAIDVAITQICVD